MPSQQYKITLAGKPTGGETAFLKINEHEIEASVRKGESIDEFGVRLCELANAAVFRNAGPTASVYHVGYRGEGHRLIVGCQHPGWPLSVTASATDGLTVEVTPE